MDSVNYKDKQPLVKPYANLTERVMEAKIKYALAKEVDLLYR
jgi:hypothetical protein